MLALPGYLVACTCAAVVTGCLCLRRLGNCLPVLALHELPDCLSCYPNLVACAPEFSMSFYKSFRAVVTVIDIHGLLAKLDAHALQEFADRCLCNWFALRWALEYSLPFHWHRAGMHTRVCHLLSKNPGRPHKFYAPLHFISIARDHEIQGAELHLQVQVADDLFESALHAREPIRHFEPAGSMPTLRLFQTRLLQSVRSMQQRVIAYVRSDCGPSANYERERWSAHGKRTTGQPPASVRKPGAHPSRLG